MNTHQRRPWPDEVARIYQEIAAEARLLAEAMFVTVAETWPDRRDPALEGQGLTDEHPR
jgi:hypothetical protein